MKNRTVVFDLFVNKNPLSSLQKVHHLNFSNNKRCTNFIYFLTKYQTLGGFYQFTVVFRGAERLQSTTRAAPYCLRGEKRRHLRRQQYPIRTETYEIRDWLIYYGWLQQIKYVSVPIGYGSKFFVEKFFHRKFFH